MSNDDWLAIACKIGLLILIFIVIVNLIVTLSGCSISGEKSVCSEYGNPFAIEDKVIRKHCLDRHREPPVPVHTNN